VTPKRKSGGVRVTIEMRRQIRGRIRDAIANLDLCVDRVLEGLGESDLREIVWHIREEFEAAGRDVDALLKGHPKKSP